MIFSRDILFRLPPTDIKPKDLQYADKNPVHCSMLAEDAIKSAISNYYTKNPKAATTNLSGTASTLPKVEVETIAEPEAQQQAAMA